ncbi:glycosyltransferase family 4 protein [Pedobacter aquatilis]|uniref:glycosyltransferase family 4 protein n=1 Tax=Pedobacter aquatilis TaxID=351343 RepID=UPI00293003C2|nr:glycosyltransferase family 4 protein [Pedobacter aquatilis]
MAIEKKRILHAIRQGKVGGGETHVLDLVNQLDKEKYESVILSFTEGPMVDKLKADGFATFVINTEKPFNFTIWNEVKQLISAQKIDLIHAHGTRANSNTFFSAKSLKIPLLYTVHGWSFHPDQNPAVKFIRSASERFLVNVANKTICVSQSNLVEGKGKFPMKNAVVIANGINRDKFNPDKEFKNIRSEFQISKEVTLVGYIARITHQKSPLTFLKAIDAINNKENLKFLIVGDGDLKADMLALAKELNLEQHIIFVDFRSDIPEILSAVDIFCLPSLWEGLPIALLEAMSMRKTIVASNIDGITDLIVHNSNGLLIEPNDVKGIADAITLLAADKDLSEKLGLAAENTVKEKFNVGLMTKKIEQVYQEFI